MSIDGDADLFYVRAHLEASGSYATFPTEKEIRTDILLFQYAGDVAASAQTFVFGAPPAFEVSISSASNQSFVVGTATPVSAGGDHRDRPPRRLDHRRRRHPDPHPRGLPLEVGRIGALRVSGRLRGRQGRPHHQGLRGSRPDAGARRRRELRPRRPAPHLRPRFRRVPASGARRLPRARSRRRRVRRRLRRQDDRDHRRRRRAQPLILRQSTVHRESAADVRANALRHRSARWRGTHRRQRLRDSDPGGVPHGMGRSRDQRGPFRTRSFPSRQRRHLSLVSNRALRRHLQFHAG